LEYKDSILFHFHDSFLGTGRDTTYPAIGVLLSEFPVKCFVVFGHPILPMLRMSHCGVRVTQGEEF
jgi:hypothetical protein